MRKTERTTVFRLIACVPVALCVLMFTGARVSGDTAPVEGRLVIVGGALNPEHDAIYRAFLEGHEGGSRIGVIPLASGVPERSGPLTVGDLQAYSDEPELIYDTALRHDEPEALQRAEVAEGLSACAALWFTGGDQIRILRAMRPESGDTAGYAAVLGVLARGGTVGGTSAGAAMMSGWMITGGSSEEAMLVGANPGYDVPGVGYVRGMGLFGYGLVDQHFLRRGRFGRLLVAMDQLEYRLGFGVSENCALVVDLDRDVARVIGEHGLTLIDLASAERDGHGWSGVRVSLLSDGDVIDPKDGSVEVASVRGLREQAEVVVSEHEAVQSVWEDYVILRMIRSLSEDRGRVVTATDGNYVYRMSADAGSAFYLSGEGLSESLTALGVRLDIEPLVGIEDRIAERRVEIALRASE